MPLTVLTSHAAIVGVLDRFISADPVRGTILGTIRASLEDAAWAAVGESLLAARSGTQYPVTLIGEWNGPAADELAGLLQELPALRGLSGTPPVVERFAAQLRDGGPSRRMGQRLFRLDELVEPVGVVGEVVVAGPPHRDLVREWFTAFGVQAHNDVGDMAAAADRAMDDANVRLWCVGGRPVSLAARRPVVGGTARIGPVYTPPAERGHGYGSGVTAATSREILAEGAIPVLFTDLANPTSNKIYRQLGYRPVEDRAVALFD